MLLLGVTSAGCGGAGVSSASSPPGAGCRSAPPQPDISVRVDQVVDVSQNPTGRTVSLHPGQTLLLRAVDTCTTAYTVAGLEQPPVLRAVASQVLPRGTSGTTQALYQTQATGDLTLQVTAAPVCPRGAACPQHERVIPVTVDVTP